MRCVFRVHISFLDTTVSQDRIELLAPSDWKGPFTHGVGEGFLKRGSDSLSTLGYCISQFCRTFKMPVPSVYTVSTYAISYPPSHVLTINTLPNQKKEVKRKWIKLPSLKHSSQYKSPSHPKHLIVASSLQIPNQFQVEIWEYHTNELFRLRLWELFLERKR